MYFLFIVLFCMRLFFCASILFIYFAKYIVLCVLRASWSIIFEWSPLNALWMLSNAWHRKKTKTKTKTNRTQHTPCFTVILQNYYECYWQMKRACLHFITRSKFQVAYRNKKIFELNCVNDLIKLEVSNHSKWFWFRVRFFSVCIARIAWICEAVKECALLNLQRKCKTIVFLLLNRPFYPRKFSHNIQSIDANEFSATQFADEMANSGQFFMFVSNQNIIIITKQNG